MSTSAYAQIAGLSCSSEGSTLRESFLLRMLRPPALKPGQSGLWFTAQGKRTPKGAFAAHHEVAPAMDNPPAGRQ